MHHAEVVAHKVGESFGSLILAVAVTVIEVGLMTGDGQGASRYTCDTVPVPEALKVTIRCLRALTSSR